MSTQENIDKTKAAYAAFSNADVDGASADLADDIVWTVQGNSTISGVYEGKEAVIGFWMSLASKQFTTAPKRFLGDGDDLVVVLTTISAEGESEDEVDVLTFEDGRVVAFETIGDPALLERVWGTK